MLSLNFRKGPFNPLSRMPKISSFERGRSQILSKSLTNKNTNTTIIAFTSRLPGEGVSTIVTGLAISFSSAETGRILVLDVSNDIKGQAYLLKTTEKNVETGLPGKMTRNNDLGIDVITLTKADHPVNKVSTFVSSLKKTLATQYDIVLIDTGSLNNASGTYWLAHSEYNILIIDSTRATRESLEYLKMEFENSKISFDGSILNKREFFVPSYLYWLTR